MPIPVDEARPGDAPDDLGDDELLGLYRAMRRVRAFEEQVVDAFGQGLIPGSTHPCIGQEGIKAGAISALAEHDLVLATYRGHGEAILEGGRPCRGDGRADGTCLRGLQGKGRLDAPLRARGAG